MPYPSRGAWRFRNVTGAFDFTPLLESIAIEEVHPDGLSTLTCDVRDTGGISFANEDRVWVKFEGDKIWAGHVKVRTRSFLDEKSQRIKLWRLQGQDYTSKLEDSVVTARGKRPRESPADRVDFILDHLNFAITTTGVDLPTEQLDPAEYENMTVREALQHVADTLILHFYIDFGPDDGGPPDLHMFRTETFDAPFELDVDDPDYADRFPFSEFSIDGDSADLKTAVHVRGDRIRQWVTDASAISTYGRQEAAISDSSLVTIGQVNAAGNRVLDQNAAPEIHGTLLCHEPGLRAGMRVPLRLDAWGLDTNYFATGVTINAVDPEDVSGKAYLFSTVAFSDKRRVGRMPGGGRARKKGGGGGGSGDGLETGGGGGGGGHTGTGGGHGGCGCPADMTGLVLDDFEQADVALTVGVGQTGVLGSLPLQTDAGAWWPGGNEWKSFLAAFVGGGGIEDGALYVESNAAHSTSGNNFSFSVRGSEHVDGPFPMLPTEAEDFEKLVRWKLSGYWGIVAEPGQRYLYLDWLFGGAIRLNFGDGTNAEGIAVIGDSVDTALMALPFDEWAWLRWRWQGGEVSGKVWAETDDEPAWQVTAPLLSSLDPTDQELVIVGRLGNATGPIMRIDIEEIRVLIPAASGELIEKHIAHGSAGIIDIGEAYEAGTLSVRVDDQTVVPDSFDPPAGTADMGAALYHDASDHPAGCAQVDVRYRKA